MSIGIDIQKTSKFPKFEDNESFYRKIFLKPEIDFCLSKSDYRQAFCSRFCVKEAVIKIFGGSLPFLDIEVFNERSGKPAVKIKGKTEDKIDISLSHSEEICVAVALKH